MKSLEELAFIARNGYLPAMELIDLLEQQIDMLLGQLTTLRQDNARLRNEVEAKLSSLTAENQALKDSLEEEKRTRAAVLGRLDALLLRLKDSAAEG